MTLDELAHLVLSEYYSPTRKRPYSYQVTDLSRCPRAVLTQVLNVAHPDYGHPQLGFTIIGAAVRDFITKEATRFLDFVAAGMRTTYFEVVESEPVVITGRSDLIFRDKVVAVKTVRNWDNWQDWKQLGFEFESQQSDILQISYEAYELELGAEIWYIDQNDGKCLTYELERDEISKNHDIALQNLKYLVEHESRHELPVIPSGYHEDKYPCSDCPYQYFCYPKEEEETE